MKDWLRLLAAFLLAAAAFALALSRLPPGGQSAAGQGVSLWYCERDCPRTVMEELLAAYEEETGETIDAVAFPDEAALADAFEERQPELLFCSHVRAAGIDARLGLERLPELPPLPASTQTALNGLEGAFFPLGGRVPLLLLDTKRAGDGFDSYEQLLRRAAEADTPFLAAESWSELLFQAMLSRDRQMSGRLAEDGDDPVFPALYNRLAEAAYGGGLALVSDAAEYVRQGLVPCAEVSSTALAGSEDGGLRAVPLPVPEGGREGCSGELMGFAILKTGLGGETERGFFYWLAAGERRTEPALDMGLVPLAPDAADDGTNAFRTLLLTLSEKKLVRYPEAALPWFANRESGEAELRERLDLLSGAVLY